MFRVAAVTIFNAHLPKRRAAIVLITAFQAILAMIVKDTRLPQGAVPAAGVRALVGFVAGPAAAIRVLPAVLVRPGATAGLHLKTRGDENEKPQHHNLWHHHDLLMLTIAGDYQGRDEDDPKQKLQYPRKLAMNENPMLVKLASKRRQT